MGNLKIASDMKKYSTGRSVYNTHFNDIHTAENLIRYITLTSNNPSHMQKLLCFGALGAFYYHSIEDTIKAFTNVQLDSGNIKDSDDSMIHEIFDLDDQQTAFFDNEPESLLGFAYNCAKLYYHTGHQVMYAVHKKMNSSDNNMHIHFAINAISYTTGTTWNNFIEQQHEREIYMNQLFWETTGWSHYITD